MSATVGTITLEAFLRLEDRSAYPLASLVRIYSREHHAWWRAVGSGYTAGVLDAGIFTFEQALALSSHCDPEKGIEYEFLDIEAPVTKPFLRPILPLRGSKAPLEATKTGCECDYCQHWSPLIDHVMSELSPERARLFNELVDEWMNTSSDLDLARAKLDGSWPGWEAMKGFKPNQETM